MDRPERSVDAGACVSITVKLSDKSRKLKKKDIRVISSDPAAGTAVIEGSGKNYEGTITVDISSGKLI